MRGWTADLRQLDDPSQPKQWEEDDASKPQQWEEDDASRPMQWEEEDAAGLQQQQEEKGGGDARGDTRGVQWVRAGGGKTDKRPGEMDEALCVGGCR